MKELNLSELIAYRKCLQNTWDEFVVGKESLSVHIGIFSHLQKRYKNIVRIIKRKSVGVSDGLYGTYQFTGARK